MHRIEDHNEYELLRRISQNDESAFRIIYNRYFDRVFSFVYRLSKSETVTEELVQDVFLRVWTSRQSLSEVINPEAYIYSVARNRSIDYLRQQAKNGQILLQLDEIILENPSAADDKLKSEDLQRTINQGLNHLSPQKRTIYQLSKVQGLSHDEIASKLNISKSTVKNHLSEALSHIRGHIGNHYDSELLVLFILFNFF